MPLVTISFLTYSLPLNTYSIDKNLESIYDQNFNDIIEFHYPAFADCGKLPLQNIQSVRKDLDCGEAFRLLTFTLPYFQVKRATAGRQAMTQHSRMRIAVLINQFKDTTHGESSSQDSQPSAQGRHSNTPSTSYWFSSP